MDEKKNLEPKNFNKKKLLLMALLAILVIALIVLAVINSSKNKGINNTANSTNQPAAVQTDNNAVTPNAGEVVPTSPVIPEVSGTPANSPVSETPPAVGNVPGETAAATTGTKPEAPIEKTNPITVKMIIDADKGFNPASFDVKAGQQVTLSITANGGVAIIVFNGGFATATGIGYGQTKDITFNAPVTRGVYFFHNDIPGKNQTCKINVK